LSGDASIPWTVIYLCSLPETKGRAAHRLCLALLPAGVAWPPTLLPTPVVSYTTFSLSPEGYLFLWPDPTDCSIPGFPRRRALWSADFPQRRLRGAATVQPT